MPTDLTTTLPVEDEPSVVLVVGTLKRWESKQVLGERLDDYVREIHDALGAVCLRRTPLEPTTDLDNLFVDPDYESLQIEVVAAPGPLVPTTEVTPQAPSNTNARHRCGSLSTTASSSSLLATFDGPARGVRCAQAISEAVRPVGVEIRAGLHTGEVALDGDQVRGIAVHIGVRVGALAGPPRSSSRPPSRTSSQGPVSFSRTPASTSSRAFPSVGTCTGW